MCLLTDPGDEEEELDCVNPDRPTGAVDCPSCGDWFVPRYEGERECSLSCWADIHGEYEEGTEREVESEAGEEGE